MRTVLSTFAILVGLVASGATAVAQLPTLGLYTIQQKSNGRFVDAYSSANNNFAMVTRTAQNNDTQRWVIRRVVSRL